MIMRGQEDRCRYVFACDFSAVNEGGFSPVLLLTLVVLEHVLCRPHSDGVGFDDGSGATTPQFSCGECIRGYIDK